MAVTFFLLYLMLDSVHGVTAQHVSMSTASADAPSAEATSADATMISIGTAEWCEFQVGWKTSTVNC